MLIALGVEYQGQDFHGWQRQQSLPTVQQKLEEALSRIADSPIQVFCAGRTDAGVHALNQVVHFEISINRPLKAWTMGVNSYLPRSIAVKWAKEMPSNFHARFSAFARRYRYIICNTPVRPAILNQQVTWYFSPLDEQLMHEAAEHLIGEHDFSSFRSAECESSTPMRHLQEISVKREGQWIIIDVQANAFLHHMVRNIVGVLLKIGSGSAPADWTKQLLQLKDRKLAAETAPAHGLYLAQVHYPEEFGIVCAACEHEVGHILIG